MKRMLYVLSAAVLFISLFSACGKQSDSPIAIAPSTDVGETYVTTSAEYTAGKEKTSEKVATGDNEYEITYYDEDGRGTKLEHYRNGKLRYYYICAGLDENGNCVQQMYYNGSDKLLGTFDNGYFFDADGTQITEDMMDLILDKVK